MDRAVSIEPRDHKDTGITTPPKESPFRANSDKFTFRKSLKKNTKNFSFKEILEVPSQNQISENLSFDLNANHVVKYLFNPNMDGFKEYSIYYPHNNMSTVISYLQSRNKGLRGKFLRRNSSKKTALDKLSFAKSLSQQHNQMKFFNKFRAKKLQDSQIRRGRKSIYES